MKLLIPASFTFLLLGFAGGYYAKNDLLGPADFDSCILKSMTDITSNSAARVIQRSCRNMFPYVQKGSENAGEKLRPAELANVQLNGGRWQNIFGITIPIYNGNDFKIKNIIVEIQEIKKGGKYDWFIKSSSEAARKRRNEAASLNNAQPSTGRYDNSFEDTSIDVEVENINTLELNFRSSCIESKTVVDGNASAYDLGSNSSWRSTLVSAEKC